MDVENQIGRIKALEKYNVDDLRAIMQMLRSPQGCPWDREQSHESIRKNFLEEVYEVCEAIDTADMALMREELGDVLLQVVFHCEMEREAGHFDFDDVCDEICRKLIVRHPHIFGDVKVKNAGEVLSNWDEIKKNTKGQKSVSEVMEGVSKALPALMRADKIQARAAKVGFDFPDATQAFTKVAEEVQELKTELENADQVGLEEELGDLLFAAVNVARLSGIDAETALSRSSEKFCRRFLEMENMIHTEGRALASMTLSEMDMYWEKAKSLIRP